MATQRRYKVTDDRFGRLAFTLREQAGLTQLEVAEALGVSRRTIQHWEAGTAFPASENLKSLIALYLQHGGFAPGREREEALALWAQADESAARRPALFDEHWLAGLLGQQRPVAGAAPSSPPPPEPTSPQQARIDWGEAPEVPALYGRDHELATLAEWTLDPRCAIVVVLGIGGMGKTSLAVRVAQTAAESFACVIWRSLRDAPPLAELLADYFQALSAQPLAAPAPSLERSITNLIALLRQQRCLLVLDNVESLLEGGSLEGRYRPGYEGYRLLFQRVAETTHQSCLLLTSREMLGELEPFEGARSPVRTLKLGGLARGASQALLQDKDLFGMPEAWEQFVQQYAGNPLALKIAAATVRNLFGGDLGAYVREDPVTLHTLNYLLEDQFARLAPLEREVLVWLAIERAAATAETLGENLSSALPKKELLAALVSLQRRSLIERSERGAVFSLLPVVLEHVSSWLVQQVVEEIARGEVGLVARYALKKARSVDYVRESQARMLVQPVLSALLMRLADHDSLVAHLEQLMERLRELPPPAQGYAGGNLVNLLATLRGHVSGCDLSRLALRQVYLEGVVAQDTSLAGAVIGEARFTEQIETLCSTALSPDGRFLAGGSFSGQVRVWQLPDCSPLWFARGHTRMAWALAFSPDATLLASGGYGGRVNVWDAASGRHVRLLTGHQQWVRTVAFQPGGATLVSAGDDATIRVWDWHEGMCLRVLAEHSDVIWSVAFSPDGSLLISGGRDGMVRLWDTRSWECVATLRHHSGGVFRVAFHADGAIAVSGGEDGQIHLWDVAGQRWLGSLQRQATGPAAVTFSPEGNLLASGSNEGAIELWEREAGGGWRQGGRLEGHGWQVQSVAFGPRGLLASLALGERLRLWDVTSGRRLRTIEGHSQLISAVAFSPDGGLLAQGDDNGMVRVWDARDGRCLAAMQGHVGPVWALAWSPGGAMFASAGDGGSVKLWPARGGGCLRSFGKNLSVIWALAFSPDGSLLASGGAVGGVSIWDVHQSEYAPPLRTIPTTWVWALGFDPSGSVLAGGHAGGEVVLWDSATGETLRTVQSSGKPVGALQFLEGGAALLSSDNEQLTWWDVATGRSTKVRRYRDRGKWIKLIALARDGARFAAGGDDKTVQLSQVDQEGDSGLSVRLSGHAGQIWAIALSADGRRAASSDDAGAVIVWDTQTGSALHWLVADRPYERMNIHGATGLSSAQRASLRALGATDAEPGA